MSKPWCPDEQVSPLRRSAAGREWARLKHQWREKTSERKIPSEAIAALALLASACVAAAILLYALAGPSDVFHRDQAADWSAVDGVRRP